MTKRTVLKITGGRKTTDGAGVKLVRVIGPADVEDFDPFLMLDAFDSRNPDDYTKGFPWHPHRGIETVTYLIHGKIEHGDSLGNSGTIEEGSCQWMTAGRGIIHQEMPQATERILGTQLWVNLSRDDKMTEPAYRDITADMVPLITGEGSEIRIISGTYEGTRGPMEGGYVKTLYLDITLQPGMSWELTSPEEDTLFCYVVEGSGKFGADETPVPVHQAALMSRGSVFKVTAETGGIRLLLISGKPLGEPIAWGGPIVMNTQEELNQAFREIRNGSFIS